VAAIVALVASLACGEARAGDAQELELGKSRVDRGEYDEAAKRFDVMLSPERPPCGKGMEKSGACRITDPELVERARAQYAIALVALSRLDEADQQILVLLRHNPAFSPNPAVFPQVVVDRFTRVRGEHQAELDRIAREKGDKERLSRIAQQRARDAEQKWVAELQRMAGEKRVVEKHSRWVAALPFGVGQFQNGDTGLGVFFAVSEILAGGASIVTGALVLNKTSVDVTRPDPETGKAIDPTQLQSEVTALKTANAVSFGLFAGLAVAGILQAQIGFVPERVRVERRPVPKRPSIIPNVAVGPGGASLGRVGRF
jgi:hypothetical protein